MTDTPVITAAEYKDDDLVYVDPENRAVLGLVQFDEKGMAKKLARPPREFAGTAASAASADDDDEPAVAPAPATPARGRGRGSRAERPRKPKVRYYPWGTYRSMKKIFKVAGKVFEVRGQATLDEVLPKALSEAFWDHGSTATAEAPKDATGDQY